MTIHYEVGDATQPIGEEDKVIVHSVNNCGVWGAGFVLAVSKKWPEVKERYVKWCKKHTETAEPGVYKMLGNIQAVRVANDIIICNCCAQDQFPSMKRPRATSYDALDVCLAKVAKWYPRESIHLPRIGCGIGGGDWGIVEAILKKNFPSHEVYVYDPVTK